MKTFTNEFKLIWADHKAMTEAIERIEKYGPLLKSEHGLVHNPYFELAEKAANRLIAKIHEFGVVAGRDSFLM